MDPIPVTNHGDTNLHLAGRVIVPGATRMIDAALVPEHLRPQAPDAPPPAPPEDPTAALLSGSVAAIVDALAGLDDDQLSLLELAEHQGKGRKGVQEGIAAERLRRAANPPGDDQGGGGDGG